MSVSGTSDGASQWASSWCRGKTVLVTGGTSGTGAAIAVAFLDAGSHVVASGLSEAELEAASRDVLLARADLRTLDVRDGGDVERIVEAIPTLDVVVNCAGIIQRGHEHDPNVFAVTVDVNLTGTMRVCAAARAKLAASSGSIVNIASLLSNFGGGLVPGYAASKGGIAQLTKSLAIAYAPDAIRVNAIAPGWIATGFTRDLQANPERNQAILDRTPLKRWGRPEDLTGGVLFLSSPLASFITGTILLIDGGYSAS